MGDTSGAPPLSLTRDGHVAELILTRPKAMNCFDSSTHTAFAIAIAELHQMDDVRAVVIGSTGDSFSAGGDVDFFRKAHDDMRFLLQSIEEARTLLAGLIDLPCPVIAAVQGPAIGLGATIAFACDMVVAARVAVFADPHVRVGLAAGDGGCLVWPQAAGTMRAKRYLLTGDRLGAEDAYLFGLVTDLVDEPDEALPAARALASKVAALAPLAVQGTKRALNHLTKARAAEVMELALSYEVQSARSDDLLEALQSREDRRPPIYAGR